MKKLITLLAIFIPFFITTLGFAMDEADTKTAAAQVVKAKGKRKADSDVVDAIPSKKKKDVDSQEYFVEEQDYSQPPILESAIPVPHEEFEEKESKVKADSDKPFICDVPRCGESYMTEPWFMKHTTTHTRKKTYKCSTCKQSFAREDHLTDHIRTHTKEKPFKCITCGEPFAQKAALTKHVKTKHMPGILCPFNCGKIIANEDDLTEHIQKHTRPHKCTKCTVSFNYRCHLKRHIKNQHPKTPALKKQSFPDSDTSLPLGSLLASKAVSEDEHEENL